MAEQKKNISPAKEAVEFLPDAAEIAEAPVPWYSTIGIPFIAMIVLSFLIWACLCKVDVIVRAPGRIVSEHGDIIMKPHESAVIKSIDVRKGDIVKAGQVLISFDPSFNQAEIERLRREIAVLETELERYQAEFEGVEYVPAKDGDGENASMQLSIFKQRQKYYQERMSYFDNNMSQMLTSIKASQESYDKYKEILGNMSTIEDMYIKLQAKNAVAYKDLLEASVSRMEVEVQVDRLRNQIVVYESQKLSLEAERKSFIEEWNNGIAEKIVSLARELDSDRKQLDKAEVLASYVTLCAPCKAIVQDMASFPVGSAVGEAEAVITLVPLDGELIAETEIRPQDISRVQNGSIARIKLTAFPFQKHGTLDGKVRMISANTFNRQDSRSANVPAGPYYRAEVVVGGKLRNVNDDFTLIPGMETEVEIKSGKRRIIEFIINPILKGLDESFREP